MVQWTIFSLLLETEKGKRFKIARNVDFKPFLSCRNGFCFIKVTEKVTVEVKRLKIGQTFQPFFPLHFLSHAHIYSLLF